MYLLQTKQRTMPALDINMIQSLSRELHPTTDLMSETEVRTANTTKLHQATHTVCTALGGWVGWYVSTRYRGHRSCLLPLTWWLASRTGMVEPCLVYHTSGQSK